MGPVLPNGEHRVPGYVAWTLIVALDGTVVVTTPIWLSTILNPQIRAYAGTICCGALGGSMLINGIETGWYGVIPPLIAGLLIHLVGVALRAFAEIGKEEGKPSQEELKKTSPPAEVTAPKPAPKAAARSSVDRPMSLKQVGARDLVFQILDSAHAKGDELPSGADLTFAVRRAGHDVNDHYGRSIKSAWNKERREVSKEQAAVNG